MAESNTDLVVGGPVNRTWCAEKWFEHVTIACKHADLTPEYVFVVPAHDEEVRSELLSISSAYGRPATIIPVKEPQRADQRVWHLGRYAHMAMLRNRVMEEVREIAPRWFLSLDSDLLIAPDSISCALNEINRFDAVGFRTFMAPHGKDFPSYGMLKGDALFHRVDMEDGCIKVDAIMAAILMSPEAYAIGYESHPSGEDIWWSKACTSAGLRLGWNTKSLAKHCMEPEALDRIDLRVGF